MGRYKNDQRVGDWNAICDLCGFKFKASELKKRWDGMMVCSEDFEQRHPQDFLKARRDKQAVPWTRPEGQDNFIQVDYFTEAVHFTRIDSNGDRRVDSNGDIRITAEET
jgi:hypothetical protein